MPGLEVLVSAEIAFDGDAAPRDLALAFTPDPATAAWLTRVEAVARSSAQRLAVYFDPNGRAARRMDRAEPIELRFAVFANRAVLQAATPDLDPPHLAAAAWRPAGPGGDDAVVELREAYGPRGLGTLGPRPVLTMHLELPAGLADTGRRYRLRLQPRTTPWKYVLVGDWADALVVDPKQEITFAGPTDEPLADGRTGRAFLSSRPISAGEGAGRFQLQTPADGPSPGRVLVARLPRPRPDALGPGDRGPVSEIYLSR